MKFFVSDTEKLDNKFSKWYYWTDKKCRETQWEDDDKCYLDPVSYECINLKNGRMTPNPPNNKSKEIKTGNLGKCVMPHNHQHVLGKYHKAGEKEIKMAISLFKGLIN